MLVAIPLSALLAWFFSYPIHFLSSLEDTRLSLYSSIQTHISNGIEYYEKDNCDGFQTCQCVVLIHGLGDTIYTWSKTLRNDSEDWEQPNILFAVNMPGSGNSPKHEDHKNYRVSELAEQIHQAMPKYPQCASWHLVGNSMGGWVATHMAYKYPDTYKSLSLFGAAGLDVDYGEVGELFLQPSPENLRKMAQLGYAKELHVPDFIFRDNARRIKDLLPVREMLHAQQKEDFVDDIFPKIKQQISLLYGDKDKVCPIEKLALGFQKLNPNAELEIAENCGHLPQKECFPVAEAVINRQMSQYTN